MLRSLIPLLMLAASIWARGTIVENIHPYELIWCGWVASNVVCGAFFGGVVVDEWHRRHRR